MPGRKLAQGKSHSKGKEISKPTWRALLQTPVKDVYDMPDSDVDDIASIQMHRTSRTKSGESSHMGSTLATPVSGQRESMPELRSLPLHGGVVGEPEGWRQRRSPAPINERSKEDANNNEPQVGIQKLDYEVDEEYEADEEADEEIDEVDLSDDSEDDELALLDPDEVDLGGFEDIDGDDPMDKDAEETSDDDEPRYTENTAQASYKVSLKLHQTTCLWSDIYEAYVT
ncbi:hypothetical protein EDB80DRAFT_813190 [Ilyonectria destructans]|nr:hypothetical protein EDB80DRAFT_813190 [Ilyonectria destructans]